MRYYLFFCLILLSQGCKKSPDKSIEKPLARVFDNYLYASDLKGVIQEGISGTDSASATKDFIEKWVRSQLLLNKAEINLTETEKDVELQIENYRSSLLIFAYQQSYLQQNLDTLVTDKEIEEYYSENKPNFILGEPMMKGLFIKVPVSAPDLHNLRQWYRSEDTENIKKLEGYCFAHATVYDHFNEGWVNLNEVLRMLPANNTFYESTLQYRKYLETRDANSIYLLYAKEIVAEGTVSPFELVKHDIHYIILNKRKIKLINELESSIYSDAQNRELFTIYSNQ